MLDKIKGELAEAKFIVEAISRKFIVSAPFGDSCEYDFIIDYNGKLNKIQVKSAWTLLRPETSGGRYGVKMGKCKGKIKYKSVDFCIVYALNVWYIIPMNLVEGTNITVYPHRDSDGKYEQYKNHWDLLKN